MADPRPEPKLVDGTLSHVRTYASDVSALTGKPLPKRVENVVPEAPKPAAPPPPKPEPVPAAKPAASQMPAFTMPQPAAAPSVPSSGPSPIHTYKTDFAAHVEKQGASPLSVLAAQQDAGAQPAVMTIRPRRKFPMAVVGGILLIVAGIGGIYAAYFVSRPATVPNDLFIPSLIFADERIAVEGSAEELRARLASAGSSAELADGEVAIVYLTYASTTEDGTEFEIVATGSELMNALRLPAPDILLRNLEPQSTLGAVRAGEDAYPFFLLSVESYERTYAGMLTWESTMERDLSVFYPPHPVVEIATTTLPSFRLSFVDEIIDNYDVRVLRDEEGRSVMLYGYRAKDLLVVARDEAAFRELMRRLAATRAQ